MTQTFTTLALWQAMSHHWQYRNAVAVSSYKNNRSLIEKRRQLSNTLLWTNGIDPNEGLEDEELLEMLISDLSQPQQGQMEPFTPVVINILKSWLQS